MTAETETAETLRAERLRIVMQLTELNAEHLRLSQAAGGAEIDELRCERAIDEEGAAAGHRDRLHEARGEGRDTRLALAECEDRVRALESRIDEIDRRLAADGGR